VPIDHVIFEAGRSRVPAKVWTDEIDLQTHAQVKNMTTLPFIHKHVAVMPDAHWGMGSTVGSVIPTVKAIIPAAVGVDLGCGMMAQRLNLKAHQLPDNLARVRSEIEAAIPHGRTDNGRENDRGAWGNPPPLVLDAWGALAADGRIVHVADEYPKLFGSTSGMQGLRQLGTLGTGNHFVELCLDTDENVWLMLHSGSRGIGNRIGSYFIEKAKEEMVRWHIDLPDPDLAYLPDDTILFEDYWKALSWAQEYARVNRVLIMEAAKQALGVALRCRVVAEAEAVNCHHNYVAIENHYGRNVYVTRKGAVRAREGDLGIIPGSMGARSFIVRGKGNPESFCSCSHGAGRRMSRAEAKRRFNAGDLAVQTDGIECRKDDGVVDEIPAAYKSIDQVMENQSDLVDVVTELRQVVCVKG
jgi:tRNA-splicing ligase RtcB (3'-phosphate/5'-hydroxy nucleic acid ligase)